jgi:cobalamin biosynthesis Mg chelatase CobN
VTSAITTTLAVPTTITGPTETITGPTSTTATTQTVTSTTSQSSSSVPTWAYATMVVLLIVGVAVGYVVKRPSASKR